MSGATSGRRSAAAASSLRPTRPSTRRPSTPEQLSSPRAFVGRKLTSAASLRLEAERREMVRPARRDDQAVDAGRVEDEAEGGLGHRLVARLGALSQPLDRGEALLG